MSLVKEGMVCVLTMGRRAGEEVTITRVLDDNFVMVKMKKGTERKSSVKHLVPSTKKTK
jgi:ribosomal protein L14E/L6E/L27E